jgi:hypothetical protein
MTVFAANSRENNYWPVSKPMEDAVSVAHLHRGLVCGEERKGVIQLQRG